MRWETLNTYRDFTKVISAFSAEGSQMGALVIVGAPGTGKSSLRRTVKTAYVVEGVATAYGLYKEICEHAAAPIIILDDMDTIWRDPRGLNLLKCLLQTDPEKTLMWNTKQPDRDDMPRKFTTTARVLIVCNTLDGAGKNFAAVVDRVIGFHFTPSAYEVHGEARSFGDTVIEPKILDYIWKHVQFIPNPSLRDYILGTQMIRSGLDPVMFLQSRWFEDPKLSYAFYMIRKAEEGDPEFQTSAQRAFMFEFHKHGTRSTYFEYQAKVLKMIGRKNNRVMLPKIEALDKSLNGQTSGLITASAAPVMPPDVAKICTGLPQVSPAAPDGSDKPKLLAVGTVELSAECSKSASPTERHVADMLATFKAHNVDVEQLGCMADSEYERLKFESPTVEPMLQNRPFGYSQVRLLTDFTEDEFTKLLQTVPANVMRKCKPKSCRVNTFVKMKALSLDKKREWIDAYQKSESPTKATS